MIFQNEKQLLKIIKYIPTLFVVSISLIILSFLYIENIKTFNDQKNEIHKAYISKSKELIKERVDNTYNYILHMQESTEKELKKSLKSEISKAHAIAYSIYENNKDTTSSEQIKKMIKDAIRPIRFNNGRGYFFIHDKNSFSNTMHPIMPKLEGRNSYNVKDARGEYIIRQMHEKLKNENETSFEWYWYKPGNKKTQYKKIGYIKNFEPYNWFIGTGEYVQDFEEQVQKKVLERIATTKYDENGYMFVIKYNGVILNHLRKELHNKNGLKIDSIKEELQNIITISKTASPAFYSYRQTLNPNVPHSTQKTSYLRGIDKWSWVIGTGFYENEINHTINKKKEELDKNIFAHMKNTIIVSIVLAGILLLLSIYFSQIIKKKFKRYKKEIDNHLQDKVQQESILLHQAKMAAMGEMIANIAHQWRQPLSSISSSATSMIVEKEINLLDDKSLKTGLEKINEKTQYLSSTIDDFRNFFNSNKNMTVFKLEESIKSTISLLHSSFKYSDIKIIKNIADIEIESYKNEFMQVIINILNNSRDALEHKDIEKLVFIDAYKNNERMILTIKDNGGGIKESILERIFDPYFTTKHQSQGTGIGLYMTNEIITKHMKGVIHVSNEIFEYENKEYTGAVFKIIIPLKNNK